MSDVLNEQDARIGRNALLYFHNEALKYPIYDISFDELILKFRSIGFHKYYLDSIGASIVAGEMTDVSVRDAMEKLARDYRGEIPNRLDVFTSYLSGHAIAQHEIEGAKQAVVDTANDIKNYVTNNSLMVGVGVGVVLLIYLKVKL